MNDAYSPLENLLSFRKPEQVSEFIDFITKESSFFWENIGKDETNFPRLAISKSGVKAIIERITNAIDAILENHKELRKNLKDNEINSPRQAIQEWFGIKGGHISFIDDEKRRELAQKFIKVTLDDSGVEKRPTVTVKDVGIGIHPDEFEKTIVGLGGSLKRGKQYVLGAYGWGGSQSLIWCNCAYEAINIESLPLAIIVSRKNPSLLQNSQKDEVGWTIIRYKDNPQEKHGVFQYLVTYDGKIPRASPSYLPSDFVYGTCVIHLAYNLESFHGRMTLASYRLFQSLTFDPILPFWLYDARFKEGRTISGNLSRLSADEKKFVEYQNTITQSMPFGEIKIRYWVLKPKKDGGYHIDSYLTKQGSSESIVITLNGQQYGSLNKQIIRDAGFVFLSDYLLFQIECDSLSLQMKKNIFPSTREDVRDQYKEDFKNEIFNILKSDEELKKLEEVRKQEHLTSGDEESIKRVRRLLDKLIVVNKKIITGGGEKDSGKKKKEKFKSKDPPTILKILPETRDLKLIPEEEKKVIVETDAPNDFLTRDENPGIIECFLDSPNIICKTRTGFLRDGKMSLYLLIDKNVPIGTKGLLVCKLKSEEWIGLKATKNIEIVSSPPPLPSNYPPTVFEILNEENPLLIRRGNRSLLQIKCDGPDGLLERAEEKAELGISFLPDLGIKIVGKSDLVRHRIRIFLQCQADTDIGKRTEILCGLDLANGTSLISKRGCVITPPLPESGDKSGEDVELPNYELVPVQPDDKNWIEFQWDETAVGKYGKSGDTLMLYVSLGNEHYINTMNSHEISAEKIEAFKEKYLSYMGYHLWLSYEDKVNIEESKQELTRINQTVLLALSQDPRFR